MIIPDTPYYHIIPITPQLLLIDEECTEYKEFNDQGSFNSVLEKMKEKSLNYYVKAPIETTLLV